MTKTLLEQAKEVKINHHKKPPVTREQFDLAMAYLCGEVTGKQVGVILGHQNQVSGFVAQCLIAGVRNGWLKETGA